MRYKILSIVTFAFLNLLCCMSVFAANSDVTSVDRVINNYLRAYQKQDMAKVMASFADNAVLLGTGGDEVALNKQQIEKMYQRDFAQAGNVDIKVKRISFNEINNIAFATYLLYMTADVKGGEPFIGTLRFTVALNRDHHKWRIVQGHFSLPPENQKLGEAFPKV